MKTTAATKGSSKAKAAKAKADATAPKKEALAKLVGKGRVKYKGKVAEVLAVKPNPRNPKVTDCRIKVGDGSTWVSGRSVEVVT